MLATAVVRFGGQTPFERSLQPAAANHDARGQLQRARGVSGWGKCLTLMQIDARFTRGDSGVGSRGDAAIAGVRPTGFADDQVPIVGFARSDELRLRALAASGCRTVMRTAATSVGALTRNDWRLDFRALSGKTARTVIRDGREQGLAVHSVRS